MLVYTRLIHLLERFLPLVKIFSICTYQVFIAQREYEDVRSLKFFTWSSIHCFVKMSWHKIFLDAVRHRIAEKSQGSVVSLGYDCTFDSQCMRNDNNSRCINGICDCVARRTRLENTCSARNRGCHKGTFQVNFYRMYLMWKFRNQLFGRSRLGAAVPDFVRWCRCKRNFQQSDFIQRPPLFMAVFFQLYQVLQKNFKWCTWTSAPLYLPAWLRF